MKNIGQVIEKIEIEKEIKMINIAIFVLGFVVIILFIKIGGIIYGFYYNDVEWVYSNETEEIPDFNNLADIIEYEIMRADLPNGSKCKDYMMYYNHTFNKYPGLDVRPIRRFDICNDGSICDNLHTFVVIGGWGMECIVDWDEYVCIDIKKGLFKDVNKTNR